MSPRRLGGWRRALVGFSTAAALLVAVPSAGASSYSAAAADTSPPTVDADFVHGATLAVNAAGNVVLTGTAQDNVGTTWVGVGIRNVATKLWLQDDGVSWGSFNRFTAALGSPGGRNTTWTASFALPAGSYVLSALARDAAKNEGRIKPWRWFKVATGDTTLPSVDADLVHRSEHRSPVTLTGHAGDDTGVQWVGIAVRDRATDLWLQEDQVSWGRFDRIFTDLTSPGAASTAWSKQLSLPVGDYMLDVRAADTAGNQAWISPWRAFSITAGSPPPPPPPAGGAQAMIIAAGDISTCANNHDEQTADLIDSIVAATTLPVTVVPVGDLAYERGTAAQFANCYDPTWGRHKAYTKPVVGNHEYMTPGASGYYDYFGATAHGPDGYYRWELAGWEIYALNSVCGSLTGGCRATSPQVQWLRSELAASTNACTLAFFHHSRFVDATPLVNGEQFWKALDQNGADVVVSAHAHYYAESRLQDWQGNADPNGLKQFIVGTGGRYLHDLPTSPHRNNEVLDNRSYGVLVIELAASSYSWEFRRVGDGKVMHSGSQDCN